MAWLGQFEMLESDAWSGWGGDPAWFVEGEPTVWPDYLSQWLRSAAEIAGALRRDQPVRWPTPMASTPAYPPLGVASPWAWLLPLTVVGGLAILVVAVARR